MAHFLNKKRTAQAPHANVSATETHKKPSFDRSHLFRVIAPFLTTAKKASTTALPVDNPLNSYLQKKPALFLRDLSAYMSDDIDLVSLLHETADVLLTVNKATGVTVYMVDKNTDEIYLSKMDQTGNERRRVKWKIEAGTTIAAYVAAKMDYVMVDDYLMDDRFPEGLGYEGTTLPKSVLCIPVMTPEGECIGVIELYRRVTEKPFTKSDLRISIMVTAWMGVAIHNNQERWVLKRQQDLNDYLLELVKCYLADNTALVMEKLMSEVIKFAKQVLGAERGSYFIVDQDSTDDLIAYLFDENDNAQFKKGRKLKYGRQTGIAGLVARTGETLNIKDAYQDSRFNKEMDLSTGYITRSILCMPVIGADGVLGVVQLINKTNGGYFTPNDENLFKTFSVYCAMAIHYTNNNTLKTRTVLQTNIYKKLVFLQHKPCIHDMAKFVEHPTATIIPADFDKYEWYIQSHKDYWNAPQYTLHMILKLINVDEIYVTNMMKFILTARKLYRDNPYHNFEHAFNVCHCMYLILKDNKSIFTNIEIKALIIAALCHDLDHGGYTNNFLVQIKHDLAQLYQKSILENHHVQITFMMLQDYEIYKDLSDDSRKIMCEEIKLAILATDLALYFEKRTQLIKLYNENTFDWDNTTHRHNIKAIMMTSCDLSGQCKPYTVAKTITANLYREFYRQGDLEKQMGLCPLSIMDRDKDYCIPEDQIQFLNIIVIPCVEVLSLILPSTKGLYDGATTLRQVWQEVIELRGKKVWRKDDSVVRSYTN